jgi:large subunit ribosomal protein L10
VAIKLEDKKAIVAEVNEAAKVALSAVVADARGVTVGAMTGLRKEAREAGVYVRVVRNTLLKRAVADTEYSVLNDVFTGPTLIAFSNEHPGAAARIFKEFAKVRISSRSRQLRSRASSSQLTRSTCWQLCRPVTKQFLS